MQVVPQYIDVEDKIVGPLTWKHLGWFFAGGALLAVAFVLLDRITFFIVAAIIISAVLALAFYKPNGIEMVDFLGYGVNFVMQPKKYIWQREVVKTVSKKKKQVKIQSSSKEKQLTSDDILALANTLDSGGQERSDRIKELIKERSKNNK